jgi:hypothetical protein
VTFAIMAGARTICSDLRIGNVRDIDRSASNTAVL